MDRWMDKQNVHQPAGISFSHKGECISEMSTTWLEVVIEQHCSIYYMTLGYSFANCCCRSVSKSCRTLWPHGLQQARLPSPSLSSLAQIHVHWICDAVQPSHPLLPPSSPVLNFPQHQGLFHWVGSSHHVAKMLELQLQHRLQIINFISCESHSNFKKFWVGHSSVPQPNCGHLSFHSPLGLIGLPSFHFHCPEMS